MTASASSIHGTSGTRTRSLISALVAALLAAGLLVALAYGQLTAPQTSIGPAAGWGPATFDHGSASMSSAGWGPATFDHGSASMSSAGTSPLGRDGGPDNGDDVSSGHGAVVRR
jgi:hypothetical protein